MKANVITTPNGTNTIYQQAQAAEFAVNHLKSLITVANAAAYRHMEQPEGYSHKVDIYDLTAMLETLTDQAEKLETMLSTLTASTYSLDKPATPSPAGSEAQALLNLLLNMLKLWRRDEVSGNEFEEWLEQSVSLASSLALNSVTEIKGGAV
ncbi:MAG: hypothetical protein L3K52_16640 [Candidatus Thiothrix sulfatifontis]|nr:MAG: hypothetical protein L3K52_16640 [Candidatus Thiothrix sulfatifontis]